MPRFMLDTDSVFYALRGQGAVGIRLLEHRPSELSISSISLAELRLHAAGTPIGQFDTLIAAHALSAGSTLVTNNTRHFERIKGLKTEAWA